MIEFERERTRMALDPTSPEDRKRSEAFENGRDGGSLYFPTTEETELSFRLGLDFRFKRLGVNDQVSANDVFARGEFFASGFLTRLGIQPPDNSGKIKTQDFVAVHNNSLKQQHLFNGENWRAYVEGSIFALGILQAINLREISKLTRLIEFDDAYLGDFIKAREYQKDLKQEAEDLKMMLDPETYLKQQEEQAKNNIQILRELKPSSNE